VSLTVLRTVLATMSEDQYEQRLTPILEVVAKAYPHRGLLSPRTSAELSVVKILGWLPELSSVERRCELVEAIVGLVFAHGSAIEALTRARSKDRAAHARSHQQPRSQLIQHLIDEMLLKKVAKHKGATTHRLADLILPDLNEALKKRGHRPVKIDAVRKRISNRSPQNRQTRSSFTLKSQYGGLLAQELLASDD
jgi:hypothetical protein